MLKILERSDSKRLARLVIGALGIFFAGAYLYEAIRMPMGHLATPGPGLFPIAVGVAGILISAVVVVEAIASGQGPGTLDLPTGKERRKVIVFLACLVSLVLLLPVLGQYVASTLYTIASIKVLSTLNWSRAIIYGAILACGLSWMFIEIFAIQLPEGVW